MDRDEATYQTPDIHTKPVLGDEKGGPKETIGVTTDGIVYTTGLKLFKLNSSFSFDAEKQCWKNDKFSPSIPAPTYYKASGG
jgi:hypothetical protein